MKLLPFLGLFPLILGSWLSQDPVPTSAPAVEVKTFDIADFFEGSGLEWERINSALEVPKDYWTEDYLEEVLVPLSEDFDPGYSVRVVPVRGLLENAEAHGDASWSNVDQCYYIRLDTGNYKIDTFASIVLYHEWAHVLTYGLPDWVTDHSDHHAIMYGEIYRQFIEE